MQKLHENNDETVCRIPLPLQLNPHPTIFAVGQHNDKTAHIQLSTILVFVQCKYQCLQFSEFTINWQEKEIVNTLQKKLNDHGFPHAQ